MSYLTFQHVLHEILDSIEFNQNVCNFWDQLLFYHLLWGHSQKPSHFRGERVEKLTTLFGSVLCKNLQFSDGAELSNIMWRIIRMNPWSFHIKRDDSSWDNDPHIIRLKLNKKFQETILYIHILIFYPQRIFLIC